MRLYEVIADVSHQIELSNGKLLGPGTNLLRNVINESYWICIGEDHGTAEIPQWISCIWDLWHRKQKPAIVLEIGPSGCLALSSALESNDPALDLKRFVVRWPDGLPFYSFTQEAELLIRIGRYTAGRTGDFVGIDQESFAATPYMLHRILKNLPAGSDYDLIESVGVDFQLAAEETVRTGDLLVTLDPALDSRLLKVVKSLERYPSETASEHLASLKGLQLSREISRTHLAGDYLSACTMRANLMKRQLAAYVTARSANSRRSPQGLFVKCGSSHLYRGFSPQQTLEVGAYIDAVCSVSRISQLTIVLMAISGTQLVWTGPGGRFEPQPIELAQQTRLPEFLRYVSASVSQDTPTLIDLRELRRICFEANIVHGKEQADVIFSFDLLITLPNVTHASLLGTCPVINDSYRPG